jgi:hypothetical protein
MILEFMDRQHIYYLISNKDFGFQIIFFPLKISTHIRQLAYGVKFNGLLFNDIYKQFDILAFNVS